MAKKESTILYHDQMAICRKHLNTEQIGRLMLALLEFEEGGDPEVEEDIAIAFEFMSLQASIDREKYEERCRKNRENGKLGGRPRKNPRKANGFFQNPNDNDNENENEAGLSQETSAGSSADQSFSSFGEYDNVELTNDQRQELADRFERSGALIDEVSDWIHNAKNHVPDHYGLCIRWAKKAGWPKRRKEKPPEPIVIADPLDPEEQERMVAQMRKTVGGMFTGS